MINAIIKELEIRQSYLSHEKIHTIYFGGGTPSILSQPELQQLLNAIHERFTVDENAEITLEANPDDLTTEKLAMFKTLGVNRLSIGIQTFDDKTLSYFNRAHDSKMAGQAVPDAQLVGFDNISIDLIFGSPNQTLEGLQSDLDQAMKLGAQHVSIYGLTIEEQTVFGKWYQQKKLVPLPEEHAASQLELIMDFLDAHGYEQYEISNFCKPGFESKHNSSYWKEYHYLGIGPSAHSYNGKSRQYNIAHNAKYLQSLDEGIVNYEIEYLSQDDKINEYILTHIRTSRGVDLDYLKSRYEIDLSEIKKKELSQLTQSDKVFFDHQTLKLTREGKLVGDYVTEKLII